MYDERYQKGNRARKAKYKDRVLQRFLICEKMKMYVHNLLSSFLSDIELELVSCDIHLVSKVTGQKKKPSDDVLINIFHIGNGGDVFLRDQEHMHRSFGMDIIEHYIIIILIYQRNGDFMGDKGAKKTHKNTVRK